MSQRQYGKVTRVNLNAGYGWLAPNEAPVDEVFFNYDALDKGVDFPEPGDVVSFYEYPNKPNHAQRVDKLTDDNT